MFIAKIIARFIYKLYFIEQGCVNKTLNKAQVI